MEHQQPGLPGSDAAQCDRLQLRIISYQGYLTTNTAELMSFVQNHPDCDIRNEEVVDSAGRRSLYALAVPRSPNSADDYVI